MSPVNTVFSNTPNPVKFVLLISIVFVSFIFSMIFGLVSAKFMFQISFAELLDILTQSTNTSYIIVVKYFQIISQFGLFIIPAVVFSLLVKGNISEYLQLGTKIRILSLLLAIMIVIVAVPMINLLVEMNAAMQLPEFLGGVEQWMKNHEEAAAKITESFLNVTSFNGLLFNLLVIAVFAAIGEEFFFRGVLQKIFQNWMKNVHLAILTSSFIFAAFHLQFYGFIPRMLLGVMFGYLFYWSGSLWLPVAAHFVNNAFAVILDFLNRKNIIHFNADKIGVENNSYFYIPISMVIFSAMIFLLYRTEKNKKKATKSLL